MRGDRLTLAPGEGKGRNAIVVDAVASELRTHRVG